MAEIDLKPTESMASNAERGLELREKHGKGGTAIGVARARDIKNRANLSPETVRRMHAFFNRHEKNKSGGEDDAGYIAWLLWGGDSGRSWAASKVKQLDRKEENGMSDTYKEINARLGALGKSKFAEAGDRYGEALMKPVTAANAKAMERLASEAIKHAKKVGDDDLLELAEEVGREVQALRSRAARPGAKVKMSAFNKGDKVTATSSVQGMTAGTTYTVTNVHQKQFPWGTFVTYELDGRLQIANGHMLLTKSRSARPGAKATMATEDETKKLVERLIVDVNLLIRNQTYTKAERYLNEVRRLASASPNLRSDRYTQEYITDLQKEINDGKARLKSKGIAYTGRAQYRDLLRPPVFSRAKATFVNNRSNLEAVGKQLRDLDKAIDTARSLLREDAKQARWGDCINRCEYISQKYQDLKGAYRNYAREAGAWANPTTASRPGTKAEFASVPTAFTVEERALLLDIKEMKEAYKRSDPGILMSYARSMLETARTMHSDCMADAKDMRAHPEDWSRPGAKAKMAAINPQAINIAKNVIAYPKKYASMSPDERDRIGKILERLEDDASFDGNGEVERLASKAIALMIAHSITAKNRARSNSSRPGAKATMAAEDETAKRIEKLFINASVTAYNRTWTKTQRILDEIVRLVASSPKMRDDKYIKHKIDTLQKEINQGKADAASKGIAYTGRGQYPRFARANAIREGSKVSAGDDAVSRKIRKLMDEGKPQKQAVAIALDLERRGEL